MEDRSDEKLTAVLQYLVESADGTTNGAIVDSVYELAPGVWGVLDRYQGRIWYDVYWKTALIPLS